MPSKADIELIRQRRASIVNGAKDIAPITTEEQKILDEDDLDNAQVQEKILNPDTSDYFMEMSGRKITLHKMSAFHTRKFYGFASTVIGSTLESQRAISGHASSDNHITGLHLKGLLVESETLFDKLLEYIVYACALPNTIDPKQVPKLKKEFDAELTMDDAFNIYCLLCLLTGVSKPAKNVLVPEPL
jgi:hypothetical protein